MEPLISVLVPVYNAVKYLSACITSIQAQTYTNLEIILVDDGSTDGSGELCDQMAKEDSRIRVIHQTNCGVAAARNAAIQAFTGEYAIWVDSDDTIPDYAVRLLYDKISFDDCDMAVAKYEDVWLDGTHSAAKPKGMQDLIVNIAGLEELAGNGIVIHTALWGKMFTRGVMKRIAIPPLTCGEDTWVFPDIILQCRKIALIDTTVYYYYERKNSITRILSDERYLNVIAGELQFALRFAENGYMKLAGGRLHAMIDYASKVSDKPATYAHIQRSLGRERMACLLKRQSMKDRIKWRSLRFPIIFTTLRALTDVLKVLTGKRGR